MASDRGIGTTQATPIRDTDLDQRVIDARIADLLLYLRDRGCSVMSCTCRGHSELRDLLRRAAAMRGVSSARMLHPESVGFNSDSEI